MNVHMTPDLVWGQKKFSDYPDLNTPVSVVQWANKLSEPQCTLGPNWLTTYGGLGWTNSGHAMRLISRTGTEGRPVSSYCERPLHSGIECLGCNECWLS